MRNFFLGLGAVWFIAALYQFFLTGDPDRGQIALQFLGMAGINFAVAGFLIWLHQRRQRAER